MGSLEAKQISNKLRGLREGLGLTQQDVAAKAGVSLSTYTKIEEGTTKRPSATVLFKLAGALGVSIDSLLTNAPVVATPVIKPKISFVYFDIGGVLVHTESSFLQPLSLRLNRPLDHVRQVYHTYMRVACRGMLSLEDLQWLLILRLNVRYRAEKRRKLFKHWVDDMKPATEAQQLATEVANSYPVGLLTDTVDGWVEQMRDKGILPELPWKVTIKSNEIGFLKPEKEVFEIATKKANVPPNEILFIDDRKQNVRGAREFGWQAEWYNELNQNASVARIKRKYF